METREILKHVDHTLLKAFATWEDIQKLCEEAIQYETASVCVPPSYVGQIHEKYGDKLNICTVIGFPLGYSMPSAKVEETRQAIADGANEIDMVINIAELKNMIEKHVAHTGSEKGKEILTHFDEYLPKFKKIIPNDYKRMMMLSAQMEDKGLSSEQAQIEAFYESMRK